MKKLLIALLLLYIGAVTADDRAVHKIDSLKRWITTKGDMAQVTTFYVESAVDSFLYIDSFSYQADTTKHKTITWTSPPQIMIWTLGGITATPTVIDSAAIGVVGCTASFAAQDLGMEFDLSTCADSSLATALDSIVAIWNGTANLTDTVKAEDSGTYIKFVTQISQAVLTARWSMLMTSDSTDTASNITTIAEVVDAMVAAINASANLDSFVTAANEADTAYTITADDPGVLFYACVDDSAQDSAKTQANVTSKSFKTDTILLVQNMIGGQQAKGINGVFFLDSSLTADSAALADYGPGLADSVIMWFAVGRERGYGTTTLKELFKLDSAKCTSSPCSLKVSRDPAAAGADTLFKEFMYLIIYTTDTASDVNMNMYYKLHKDYLLLDD